MVKMDKYLLTVFPTATPFDKELGSHGNVTLSTSFCREITISSFNNFTDNYNGLGEKKQKSTLIVGCNFDTPKITNDGVYNLRKLYSILSYCTPFNTVSMLTNLKYINTTLANLTGIYFIVDSDTMQNLGLDRKSFYSMILYLLKNRDIHEVVSSWNPNDIVDGGGKLKEDYSKQLINTIITSTDLYNLNPSQRFYMGYYVYAMLTSIKKEKDTSSTTNGFASEGKVNFYDDAMNSSIPNRYLNTFSDSIRKTACLSEVVGEIKSSSNNIVTLLKTATALKDKVEGS